MTQLSREHFADRYENYEKTVDIYALDSNALKAMKKSALVMHPFPWADELPDEVDRDPRAVYLRQTHYGLRLRMAILCPVLNHHPRLSRINSNDKP